MTDGKTQAGPSQGHQEQERMGKFEKQLVTYTSACHGLVHVLELTFGVVLIGIAEEFGAGLFIFGILANIFGFAFGATALPSGYLADRMSERRLLILCCLGMGVSSVAVGLSPNIYVLGAALLALGVALGILHPTGTAFVARVASQRGQGFGYFGTGGNLGIALGPIMAGAIASALGWRASYLVFAIPALLLGVMFYLSGRAEVFPEEQPATQTSTDRVSLRPVALLLVLVFSAQVMNGFIYRGTVTFLPMYLAERTNFSLLGVDSLLIAGSLTTIALLFGVGGILLSGYLVDRKRPEILAVLIALVCIPLLLLMGTSEGLMLIIFTAAFAFVYFMGQPVYNSLVADYSPTKWRGRMFGISFFCSFGFGSFSASLLGYVAEKLSTNWIFWVIAGFQLLVLVLAITLYIVYRSRTMYSSSHVSQFLNH